jgi:cell division septation protein DedD
MRLRVAAIVALGTFVVAVHAALGVDPTARPYGDDSPFNTPIPADVEVLPNSATIVANSYLGTTPLPMRVSSSPDVDWSHPIYYAADTDPTYTVQCGSGGITGAVIQIPYGARPTRSSDGHMAIVQPDGWEYDLWQAGVPANGVVTCSIGYRQRYDGLGAVTPMLQWLDPSVGGGTAANFGLAAGLIRASELQAGVIPHALFAVIRNGAEGSVYPATKGDATGNPDGPVMGQRFRLNLTDEQIDSSCAPGWEQTIATAMAHYGLYFGDTGGDGFGVMLESSLSDTAIGEPDPWAGVATMYGIPWYPTWGYVFRWSGCIDYGAAMQAIAGPPDPTTTLPPPPDTTPTEPPPTDTTPTEPPPTETTPTETTPEPPPAETTPTDTTPTPPVDEEPPPPTDASG